MKVKGGKVYKTQYVELVSEREERRAYLLRLLLFHPQASDEKRKKRSVSFSRKPTTDFSLSHSSLLDRFVFWLHSMTEELPKGYTSQIKLY
jgi:hypothetical protein